MTLFFAQSITRRRAPVTTDAHGNEVRDWTAAVDTVIDGVNVQPNAQNETDTALRTAVTTAWRIQSAPGVDLDITADDRVVILDGDVPIECEVVGEVARWPHPVTGRTHHVEFTVERIEG